MKKLISLILAIFVLVSPKLGAIPAFADFDEIRARRLPASSTALCGDYKVTALSGSVTAKETVTVAADEMLVIRRGASLRLKKGARADGVIYAENGAKLLLSEGTLTVSGGGAVFSDGLFSVGKKAVVSVRGSGEIFIGKKGSLKVYHEDSLRLSSAACAICLGKCNSENAAIGKKAAAAYVFKNKTLSAAEKPETLLPTGSDYRVSYPSKNESVVIFIFDSGASLRAVRSREAFSVIGSCPVGIAEMITQTDGGKNCSRMYEIDGRDYVTDTETGGAIVLLERDGTLKKTDETDPADFMEAFSPERSKSLGALGQYALGEEPNADIQAYLLSDGTILAMGRETNPPPELLNAPPETLDRLYNVFRLLPIE